MEIRPSARTRLHIVKGGYIHLPPLDIARGEYALRPVAKPDIEAIRQWRNAQMEVLRQAEPITPEMQQRYFERVIWPQMDRERPAAILLAVMRAGEMIGYGGLVHCAWDHCRAEISILFAPEIARDPAEYRRCLRAFLAMLEELAFARLRLRRLTLETYDIRPFHVGVLEEAGYLREGRLREHVTMAHERIDSLLHAKLASDWLGDWQGDGLADQVAGGRMTSAATRSIRVPAAGGS